MSGLSTRVGGSLDAALEWLHVPEKYRAVVIHCLVVFIAAFVAQFVPHLVAGTSLPVLESLAISAGAAGLSAVGHYLTGLLPDKP
jgi:hypothetical protein